MHNRFTVLHCPKWVQVNRCQCVTSGVSQILQEENVEMEVKAGTRPQRRSKVGWGMSLGIRAASSPMKGSWRGSNSMQVEESNRHVGLTKDLESQKWAFGTEAAANPTDARAGLLASYFCSWTPSFFIFSLWREAHTAYPCCCTTFLSIYYLYIYNQFTLFYLAVPILTNFHAKLVLPEQVCSDGLSPLVLNTSLRDRSLCPRLMTDLFIYDQCGHTDPHAAQEHLGLNVLLELSWISCLAYTSCKRSLTGWIIEPRLVYHLICSSLPTS